MKTNLTKEELVKELKLLSDTATEYKEIFCAVCYSVGIMADNNILQCDLCGKKHNAYFDLFHVPKESEMRRYVKDIRRMGYDAKIEFLCGECAWPYGYKYSDGSDLYDYIVHHIFSFKTKDQAEFHSTVVEKEDDYNALMAFLKGEPTYKDYAGYDHSVNNNLKIIERMTGLKIERNDKE